MMLSCLIRDLSHTLSALPRPSPKPLALYPQGPRRSTLGPGPHGPTALPELTNRLIGGNSEGRWVLFSSPIHTTPSTQSAVMQQEDHSRAHLRFAYSLLAS